MNKHLVLIVNDTPQGEGAEKELQAKLDQAFADEGETFDVMTRITDLTKESIDLVVSDIISRKPQPDAVLIDANMPVNRRDGVRVIDALRRAEYQGFTYLWSASNPAEDIELFPAMLKGVGTGGFIISEVSVLASKVRSDWRECGQNFVVSDPTGMSLIDPTESALLILNEFLPGCLRSELNENDADEWNVACKQALDLFRDQPGNFSSAVESFPNHDSLRLQDAARFMTKISQASSNDHGVIIENLKNLRDALLDVSTSCQETAGFGL